MRYWFPNLLITVLVVPSLVLAQTYKPSFDPGSLKGPQDGTPNQILVLGSPHLSQLPDSFRVEELKPLIEGLALWQPEVIAIEAVSGPQCDFMRHYPDRYRETIESYCWDSAPARAATGLGIPAATAEVERLLTAWPAKPTASQRRHLAALFLASADQASALVQWLQLPEDERRTEDGLDATLVARLNEVRDRHNENFQIAAPLAARLGLERLYPIDDHTADSVVVDEKAYAAAITKAWDNPATDKRKATDKVLTANVGLPGGVLEMYRAYNIPSIAMLTFKSDFGAALEEPSPQKFGRGYVGYWETRNLRMASNIRDALAARPGVRALVIVGASHKAYLEDYLDQMHDVRIVDAEIILR